jgi:hypothetical protein
MPDLTVGNTVYTCPVAKVMISIPDDLLERLDAQARANQETRSGFLQRLVERELESAGDRRRAEARRLLDKVRADFREDEPRIDAAQLIREDRESH